MAKLTTIKVPTTMCDGTEITEERSGHVVLLEAGQVKVKCFLQLCQVTNEPSILVHYASGMVIKHNLKPIRIRFWGSGKTISYRQAAQIALSEAVERLGEQVVLGKIKAAPKLN